MFCNAMHAQVHKGLREPYGAAYKEGDVVSETYVLHVCLCGSYLACL